MKKCFFFLVSTLFAIFSYAQTNKEKAKLFVQSLVNDNGENFAYTKGNFGVSDNGAMNYEVPISCVQGAAGMTPKLSVVYNSYGGSGIFGEGWSLSGLSIITRTNQNYAIDGKNGRIEFNENDRLLLDGQRLVNIDTLTQEYWPTSLKNNVIYYTEQNSFKRVTSFYSNNKLTRFEVRTKDGLIYHYGSIGDGQSDIGNGYYLKSLLNNQTISWLLVRIEDLNQNIIDFEYDKAALTRSFIKPTLIKYTGRKITPNSFFATVAFNYQQISTQYKYINGQKIQFDEIVRSIVCEYKDATSAPNSTIRTYKFNYLAALAQEKYFIKNIQECINNNDCLTTEINWQKSNEKGSFSASSMANLGKTITEDYQVYTGDFNGDGLLDNVSLKVFVDKVDFLFSRNVKGHFEKAVEFTLPSTIESGSKILIGDFDGNGTSDISFSSLKDDGLSLTVAYTPSNLNGLKIGMPVFGKTFSSPFDQTIKKSEIFYSSNDFNGDGLPDIYTYYYKAQAVKMLFVINSPKNDFTFQPLKSLSTIYDNGTTIDTIPNNTPINLGDYNSDGVTDLLFTWLNNKGLNTKVFLIDDNLLANEKKAVLVNKEQLKFTEINLLQLNSSRSKDTVGITALELDSVVSIKTSKFNIFKNNNFPVNKTVYSLDINRDGNSDLLVSDQGEKGWKTWCLLGKGNGDFEDPRESAIDQTEYKYSAAQSFGDFNGDGQIDVCISMSDESGWLIKTTYGFANGFFKPNPDSVVLSSADFSYSVQEKVLGMLPIEKFVKSYPEVSGERLKKQNSDEPVPDDLLNNLDKTIVFFVNKMWSNHPIPTSYFGINTEEYFDNYSFNDRPKELGDNIPNLKRIRSINLFPQSGKLTLSRNRLHSVNSAGDPLIFEDMQNIDINSTLAVKFIDYWKPIIADLNGDGITDVALTYSRQPETNTEATTNDLSGDWKILVSLNQVKPSGKIDKIVLGNGADIQIEYGTTTELGAFDSEKSGISYPNVPYNIPINVVKSTKSPNGIKGYNKVNYEYKNGIIGITGRGFMGFEKTTITSETDGHQITKKFSNDPAFMKYGILPLISIFTKIGNTLVKKDFFRNSIFNVVKTIVVFNFITFKQSESFDLNAKVTQSIRSTFTYDKYGNLIESKSIYPNAQADIITNEYFETSTDEEDDPIKTDNLNRWIIGRLKSTTIYKGKSGTDQILRKSMFSYYPVTGQLKLEKTLVNTFYEIEKKYSYDERGNKIKEETHPVKSPQDIITTTYEYSNDYHARFLTKKTDAENYSISYKPNSIYSFNEEVINANGNSSKLDFPNNYDPFGRKKKVINADGTWATETNYKCNTCGVENAVYFKVANQSGIATPIITYFDMLDRPVKKITFDVNYNRVATSAIYNSKGELFKSSLPYFDGRIPASPIFYTMFTRDPLGRIIKIANPDGTVNKFEYDGLKTIVTNNQGQTNTVINDFFGRKEYEIDNLKDTVQYRYDLDGHNTEIIDQTGRKFYSKFDKDLGKIVISYNANVGHETSYTYDSWGEIAEIKYGYLANNSSTFTYDKIGRTKSVTERKSTLNGSVNAPRNKAADIVDYEYVKFDEATGGKGKLKSVKVRGDDRKLNKEFNYDNLGRLIKKSFKFENVTSSQDAEIKTAWNNVVGSDKAITIDYSYNTDGQIETITYPKLKNANYQGAFSVKYSYENGSLKLITAKTKKLWEYLDCNPDGTPRKIGVNDNKTITDYNYNLLNQNLEDITTFYNSTTKIQKWQYSYDPLNNIKSRVDVFNSPTFGESYSYDGLNRIKTVSNNNILNEYRYDKLGNIEFRTDVGYYVQRDVFLQQESNRERKLIVDKDKNNSLKMDEGMDNDMDDLEYYYDLVGNRYKKEINEQVQYEIEYNHFNKPKVISENGLDSKFKYDEQNNLQIEEKGEEIKYYIDGTLEFEYKQGSGFQQTLYIAAGGNVFAYNRIENNSHRDRLFFIHKDVIGSTTSITDEKGKPTIFAYDIWGVRLDPTNWKPIKSGFPIGFTGHQHWDDLRLINTGGRLYDPAIGQFLQVDPALNLDVPSLGLTAYSYCFNSPLYYTDPSGYWSIGGFFNGIARGILRAYIAGPTSALLVFSGYRDFIDKNAGTIVTIEGMIASAILTPMGVPPALTAFATGFASAFSQSYLNGGTFGQSVEAGLVSGIISGVTAGITSGIADAFMGEAGSAAGGMFGNETANYAGKAVAQAAFYGAINEAQGGNFWQGALPALISSAADPMIGNIQGSDISSRLTRTAISATIGGTASVIGGGKFANGAITGAVLSIYNNEMHRQNVKILTVRDHGIGTHSAIYIEGDDGSNIIYDPNGGFPSIESGPGRQLTGNDANLDTYISYHKAEGSTVDVQSFSLSTQQRAEILNRIEAHEPGGILYCTRNVVDVINNVGPFTNVAPKINLPGLLYNNLQKLQK